jgi:hypothetical protein
MPRNWYRRAHADRPGGEGASFSSSAPPGFDHWVSFKGQGSFLPSADGLNVNGRPVPQKG